MATCGLIILELKADNDLAIQTTDILKVCQNMKTRENDQKNSKEKEKFPMAGVPDRKVTALSIDCLQSAFFLKIHLVLISASAIANHDVTLQ